MKLCFTDESLNSYIFSDTLPNNPFIQNPAYLIIDSYDIWQKIFWSTTRISICWWSSICCVGGWRRLIFDYHYGLKHEIIQTCTLLKHCIQCFSTNVSVPTLNIVITTLVLFKWVSFYEFALCVLQKKTFTIEYTLVWLVKE